MWKAGITAVPTSRGCREAEGVTAQTNGGTANTPSALAATVTTIIMVLVQVQCRHSHGGRLKNACYQAAAGQVDWYSTHLHPMSARPHPAFCAVVGRL